MRKIALMFGLTGVFSTGCVSTKTYQQSQMETQSCLREKKQLAQKVEDLQNEKVELAQSGQAKEAELTQVKSEYADVVADLNKEITSGQIQVTELKDKLTLNMVEKILFNSGQANVKESGKSILSRIADALRKVDDKDVRVEGYTDNVPLSPKLRDRFPTNWELSTARATNVVRYLVETAGLDPSRLIAAGFGEYHPIVSNATEEGRAQNRRIDIVLVPHEVSGNAAFAHTVAESSATVTGTVEPSSGTIPEEPPQ